MIDRYFNWQQLDNFSQSISLFTTLRLLELNFQSSKPGVEAVKALTKLFEHPIPDTSVIIILPELDWRDQKTEWYKLFESSSVFILLEDVPFTKLPEWIANRLAIQNQETDRESLDFIANQVEGNLLAADQEIQKLGLLYPTGKISRSDVRNAVLNVSRFDAFQLTEAVFLGDVGRTIRILNGLQDEGVQPIAVMNPILWSIKPMIKVKQALTNGETLANALSQLKIFGERQNLIKAAVTRLSLRQLLAAHAKLAEIDKTAKGLLNGDAWLEISRLCFGLARIQIKRG